MGKKPAADPESILTSSSTGDDSVETLLLARPNGLPSPVETAISHYADSLERLMATSPTAKDDPYTRGFVAGLRAAATVAANVAGT